jgi:Flp pilus assembly secretin CpaC
MAAVAKANKSLPIADTTQGTQIVRGTITLSGNYGAGGAQGDTLSFAVYPTQSPKTPLEVRIYEVPATGTAPTGYVYSYLSGTNASNGQFSVAQGSAGTAPTIGSAYPTGLVTAATAGYLHFTAYFPLGQ